MILDGTYFHQDGCLLTLMNAPDQRILSTLYTSKEGFHAGFSWLRNVKARALEPLAFTVDGERSTLRAIHLLWPQITVQRCLYHLQHEGCRWLRTYPKTAAAQKLRNLLLRLTGIRSIKERNQWIADYQAWLAQFEPFVLSLPRYIKANLDLKRTIRLINNALPNMFHYLMDPLIPSTTNALEGWHSRIKRAYRQHSGLIQRHKIQFLKWFSFYENQQKINNL
jgi:transposase-like protein